MKILELCHFSAGICGVWTRVREESLRLSDKGNEVRVFSSNLTKGTNEIASDLDRIGKVVIRRFSAIKLGGESFMKWNFEKEALEYEPEIIIAHCYRHPHTTKALKVAETLRNKGKKCKVFLVTHAPFERNETRKPFSKFAVWYYDKFIGPKTLNRFYKILAITQWEIPYLVECGANTDKIEYIPNGIPEEFFRQKKSKEKRKILFLGRISPIKNIETVISALPLLADKKIQFEIVGPAEKEYLERLKKLAAELSVEKQIIFGEAIYDIGEKIRKIDSASIFVLPSKSEGMPQGLIEAMARGKRVIASDNLASKDLIIEGKTGYLFEIGNSEELAIKINDILKNENKKVGKEAAKYVKQFSWDKIIVKILKFLND